MKLLLDTHAFIWFDASDAKLSATAADLLRDPANTVLLSVVSVWEMQVKARTGKLIPRDDVRQLVDAQVQANQVTVLDLTLPHIWAAAPLPMVHKDPFDRLLVAQALAEGATLVTIDANIQLYPAPTMW